MGEIRRISDMERELQGQVDRLSAQVDAQGGQLAVCRDRMIAAEAEVARLRTPVRTLAECRIGPCDCDPHVEYCDQCAPFMFPKKAAPPADDVGSLEYKGNSVSFIYQKMTAYRRGIDDAWAALKAAGVRPTGALSVAGAIALIAPPAQEGSPAP